MTHKDRTNITTPGGSPIPPGVSVYEIFRGQASPVLSASGFIKQFDSGDIQTVLVEVVPLSAAYNLIHAL